VWRSELEGAMSEPFKGTVNVDIRDSVPGWSPFEPPRAPDGSSPHRFTGGTINRVVIDVSGEPYLGLERQAAAMLARE
jgi:hypothetical protein